MFHCHIWLLELARGQLKTPNTVRCVSEKRIASISASPSFTAFFTPCSTWVERESLKSSPETGRLFTPKGVKLLYPYHWGGDSQLKKNRQLQWGISPLDLGPGDRSNPPRNFGSTKPRDADIWHDLQLPVSSDLPACSLSIHIYPSQNEE